MLGAMASVGLAKCLDWREIREAKATRLSFSWVEYE